jgi:hypothetical protein
MLRIQITVPEDLQGDPRLEPLLMHSVRFKCEEVLQTWVDLPNSDEQFYPEAWQVQEGRRRSLEGTGKMLYEFLVRLEGQTRRREDAAKESDLALPRLPETLGNAETTSPVLFANLLQHLPKAEGPGSPADSASSE